MNKKYKIAVTVTPLEDGSYMANSESVRATAVGDTPEEAVEYLHESIADMVNEFGEDAVFQDIYPNTELRILECAV